MSRPMTHATADPADGRLQLCRCSVCNVEAVCTPRFDFYVEGPPAERAGKPLVCETCFFGRLPMPRIPDVIEPTWIAAARYAREMARFERRERAAFDIGDLPGVTDVAALLAGDCALRVTLAVVAEVGPVITPAHAWEIAAAILAEGWSPSMPIVVDTRALQRPVVQA